jgi:hypothetical protein
MERFRLAPGAQILEPSMGVGHFFGLMPESLQPGCRRSFDGSHLLLPGMNREHLRDGDLSRHQKDAVWRVVQSGSTLLAHVSPPHSPPLPP